MNYNTHYSETYFTWQEKIGMFGGWANVDKFRKYLETDYNVIDFGSGGGYLLNNIECKDKIGIEINESAIAAAKKLGVPTVNSTSLIQDNWADLIISNNALEHTLDPLEELKELRTKLKKNGKIIFVVPCESINYKYEPDNINYHLFSWSPMCMGNLFNEAGFKVIESKAFKHKWPPYHRKIADIFGRKVFNICCRIYARLEPKWHQVRVIAEKIED